MYADFDMYEFGWNIQNIQSGSKIIRNPGQNFFTDTSYVEGYNKQYNVFLYFTGGGFLVANKTFREEVSSPITRINKDFTVDVLWRHSKYEKSVQGYCIKTSVPIYGSWEEHDIADLNDTVIRLNQRIGFGEITR